MAITRLVEYEDASPEVRAVYDDIMATRGTDWINDFWKAIAHHPPTLARVWAQVRQTMAPGALDPLTKELLYIAVSATNGCAYCVHSHTASARAKGMDDAMLGELMAVVALANQTNALAHAYQVPVDARFSSVPPRSPA
jgi:AhpD family alkylhydroperoxidase